MSGELPEGWTSVTIGQVAAINLESLPANTPTDFLLRYIDVATVEGPSTMHEPRLIKFGEAPSRARRKVTLGDILVSTVRPYLRAFCKVVSQEKNLVASTAFAVLHPQLKIDGDFLYQHILSDPFIDHLTPRMKGSNYPAVTASDVSAYSFPLPPLPEQRRIAEILSSVDEAIAATRAVIEQTRKVKQAVLERLLTKGIGHTRFKQTEIGEIPEGWEIADLFDVLREPVRNGYSPISPPLPTGGWLLSLSSLSHDGLNIENLKPAPMDDPRIVAAKLSYGDVVISRSNTPDRVGMAGVYKGHPDACYFPDLMICLRFNEDEVISEFGALWLRHLQASGHFKRAASGTSASMVKINRMLLSQIRIAVPSIGEQNEIVSRFSELHLAISVADSQLNTLHALKSALMSDLLTGRKRVSDPLTLAAE